jgi:asparagine synthase (glutamine-hydrolysing)
MCGIAGFLASGARGDAATTGLAMAAAIASRGPDDAGVWTGLDGAVVLAHRRLSIVDLSPAGHQPMQSPSGRWTIVFNGEIYNHLRLRTELGEQPWRGHSDTETLLTGFDRWGLRGTIERCVGMFAFAAWDAQERTLVLGRDRFGEKPLYYGWQGDAFLFGSELKALARFPSWRREIDREALALYMRHNCVPAPRSIYRGIFKLPPASLLALPFGAAVGMLPAPETYWRLTDVAERSLTDPFRGSDAEAVDELERLLKAAVADQMVADVPLGAFLSGGIDSSTVVALMQAQSARPVRTFSIGFHEQGYDEAQHAKAVARHLGTEHMELYVSPAESLAVIPRLPEIYDEPFADSSQIPTFLVSQMARRHVTVALSGDAGDELFGGYTRYFAAAGAWARIGTVPRPLRRIAAAAAKTLPVGAWDRVFRAADPLLPRSLRWTHPGDKLHKAAGVIAAADGGALYRGLVTHWEPADVVIGAGEPDTVIGQPYGRVGSLTEQMMLWDGVTYLPDDILVKVDRAAMAVSLETRVPMLDHRVAEFAWRLPIDLKVRNGEGKWALRQVLYRHVPRALIERPKMGFGVPIDHWLRGPLRAWADDLLQEDRLRADGFFIAAAVRRLWNEHQTGVRNWQYLLWDVLMFQAWKARWQP